MKNKFILFLVNSFNNKNSKLEQEKKIIVARDPNHLKILIKQEIKKNGNDCDLNHIDLSGITDMYSLFSESNFNGDISKWNVSNVTDMSYMFFDSKFTGDLTNWKPYNLAYTENAFTNCL